MSKERTGYPSIDKPQSIYYRDEPIIDFDVNQTMYDVIVGNNQGYYNKNAIKYLNNNISYGRLIRESNLLASALKNYGIKKGDIVPIFSTNTPEMGALLMAINKIGAVSKWLDLTYSDVQLLEHISEGRPKLLFALNDGGEIIEKVVRTVDDSFIEKVVTIVPTRGLVFPINKLAGAKFDKKDYGEKFCTYDSFLKYANKHDREESVKYDKYRPSLIVQSSGTTGKAKSIVHSDYTVNSSVKDLSYSDIPFEQGERLFMIAPNWVAYGLINSFYHTLCLRMQSLIHPTMGDDLLIRFNGKYDIVFAVPIHYRYMLEHQDELKGKLEGKAYISGGDKISIKELERLRDELGILVANGYGSNEIVGAGAVNPISNNKFGTVGIPLHGNIYAAFNDNLEELKYNEEGELCVKSDSSFLYYENNLEKTDEIKQKHSDNSEWIHTGDLGHIDEEGYITLSGRLTRSITRGAFKISPITIEEVVMSHEAVKECVVVAANDEKEVEVPYAYIVLKEDYIGKEKELEPLINDYCISNLKDLERPAYIDFIESIPYTPNNKQDYRMLTDSANAKVNCKSKELLLKKYK